MDRRTREERIGVVAVLTHAALWGMYPLVLHRGTQVIPPLLFISSSILLASIVIFIYAAVRGTLSELKRKEAYRTLLLVTLFIIIIPFSLVALGAGKTSGLNTSMLLLAELIFTIIFTHFIGERTTRLKLIGAGGICAGAVLLLYQGGGRPSVGDALVIASTVTYPVGNFYTTKRSI